MKIMSSWQGAVVGSMTASGLPWSCIDRLANLLTSPPPVEEIGGEQNFWARVEWSPEGDMIADGSCHYGSRVVVRPNMIKVVTCGGHWIQASLMDGETIWETDGRPSVQSWGDCDCPEEGPCNCKPGDLVARRAASLKF